MNIPLWREIQKQNFTLLEELATFLNLDAPKLALLLKAPRFPLNLPRRLAEKIEKNNLDDPLLRQFVPLLEESMPSTFPLDPVQDARFRKNPKLLHKYASRALLLVTSACAMHCRFCFRQHFPYEREEKGYEKELEQIADDPSLKEIILSGGDPLSISNAQLEKLVTDLSNIPHLRRLRFHTRFPIGIPERIDEGFLKLLSKTRLQTWFILHCNHASELDTDVLDAMKKISKLGVPVLCQTVLLKGVNDSLEALKTLAEKLVDHGIAPYYLHQLDQVQGAAHFEVKEEEGKNLIQALSSGLSGYGLYRYVKEIPGESGKTPIQ